MSHPFVATNQIQIDIKNSFTNTFQKICKVVLKDPITTQTFQYTNLLPYYY